MMKHLILIKQSPAIQLGHLYEHIFYSHVDTFFCKHHLFPYLDYLLIGKAYYGGIVCIGIELYTKEAIALSSAIPDLAIDINKTTISIAASQILAEKEERIGSTGYDDIKRDLKDLHARPWQNIDDIELIDTKKVRTKTGSFYIAEGKPLPAKKLTVSIVLNAEFAKVHRELLPLFRQLSLLVILSLQETLADTYGYYSLEDKYKNNGTASLSNIFKVPHGAGADVDLSDILQTSIKVVQNLQQYDAFERYMSRLHRTSYYDNPILAPRLERNYEDTLIFIGAKGWRQIATKQNCYDILKNATLEVKFGKDKVSTQI